jgi:hypothetical protein
MNIGNFIVAVASPSALISKNIGPEVLGEHVRHSDSLRIIDTTENLSGALNVEATVFGRFVEARSGNPLPAINNHEASTLPVPIR